MASRIVLIVTVAVPAVLCERVLGAAAVAASLLTINALVRLW
ncbi:hypothetical protein [Actinoplanes palleronii]|uniref:Uncharacterized protein n=1 Tax=Actinoplanes palleronii TaxID=113570 RepID=A0ABQ4B3Z0_9ACTN|nr:hypothetical protein [Actinoplanes palleronii]GIE65383.1 hypothetical protein Apa02nite_014910 [Actinoplanes palleronii]